MAGLERATIYEDTLEPCSAPLRPDPTRGSTLHQYNDTRQLQADPTARPFVESSIPLPGPDSHAVHTHVVREMEGLSCGSEVPDSTIVGRPKRRAGTPPLPLWITPANLPSEGPQRRAESATIPQPALSARHLHPAGVYGGKSHRKQASQTLEVDGSTSKKRQHPAASRKRPLLGEGVEKTVPMLQSKQPTISAQAHPLERIRQRPSHASSTTTLTKRASQKARRGPADTIALPDSAGMNTRSAVHPLPRRESQRTSEHQLAEAQRPPDTPAAVNAPDEQLRATHEAAGAGLSAVPGREGDTVLSHLDPEVLADSALRISDDQASPQAGSSRQSSVIRDLETEIRDGPTSEETSSAQEHVDDTDMRRQLWQMVLECRALRDDCLRLL